MPMYVARPFTGTPEEAAANEATHQFDWEYARCMQCDCRPWGVWAVWPCNSPEQDEVQFIDGEWIIVE
jgi:hypothetical protein